MYIGDDGFVSATMARSRESFAHHNHNPSDRMIDALAEIPRMISSVIRGRATSSYFVCPLDCGVGKTVTLTQSLRALDQGLLSGTHHIGAVICVGRYVQIDAVLDDLTDGRGLVDRRPQGGGHGLDPRDIAVFVSGTSNDKVTRADGSRFTVGDLRDYGAGMANLGRARVLVTTHNMVTRRLAEGAHGTMRSWSDAPEFFYRGKSRQLRVWDEEMLPGIPVVVTLAQLARLVGHLDRLQDITPMLWDLFDQVRTADVGTFITTPDLASAMSVQQVLGNLTLTQREAIREDVENLWMLSSGSARVTRSGIDGRCALDFRARLPEDMKPMLVLDASARLRATYGLQQRDRGDLVILKDAPKKFDRVKVHVERVGSGKETFAKNAEKIAQDVADIVNRHGPGQCLVLHHQPGSRASKLKVPDFAGLVTPLVKPSRKPAFLTWGQHDATNAYADRSVVICASTYYYDDNAYEARGRAASGRQAPEEFSPLDTTKVRRGEVLAALQQGLNRGAARRCEGDYAHAAKIFVRLGGKGRVDVAVEDMELVMPGSEMLSGWRPNGRKITRRKEPANSVWMTAVRDVLPTFWPTDEPVTREMLRKATERHLGTPVDRGNFRKHLAKATNAALLAKDGYHIEAGGQIINVGTDVGLLFPAA